MSPDANAYRLIKQDLILSRVESTMAQFLLLEYEGRFGEGQRRSCRSSRCVSEIPLARLTRTSGFPTEYQDIHIMRKFHCHTFLILVAAAAVGILPPLNARGMGMQALPVVPLSNQQGPYQLGPENKVVPGSIPILPPVPGALLGVDAEGVDDEAEPMLRGPVHEAFAEQFNQDPVEGQIVPQQPPESIEELPPDVRPDGRQVEWISGYWAWDDDDQDFFWVSGIWREVPQGFRWLPGYWTKADTGYQWVSGTWIPEQTEEIQYVETAPPESLELGPVGVGPSPEHIWIPGCWNWNNLRYAWRPGYWSTGYSNWLWVPARHVWTPRGYLNCNGYWDYPLNRRGLLFAPYRFRRAAIWNRSRGFTPRVIIAANLLPWNLWVRPRSGHYYGPRYASAGFFPWHQFNRQRHQFDPLYSHFSRSAGVGNVNFYDQVNGRFNLLTSHADRRPARTFNHHDGRDLSRLNITDDQSPFLGTTLQQHVKAAGNTRFVKLQEDQRIRLQTDSKSLRQLVDQRREVENRGRLESTRMDHHANASTERTKNADQHDTERQDRPAGPETRRDENQSDVAKSFTPPLSRARERSDRLRLPPVIRHGNDDKGLSDTGPSANLKASESRTPGSPVTRGERPRGVDPVLNRERTPANSNSAGSQKGNSKNNIRDRAARSGAQPDKSPGVGKPQKEQDLKPLVDHRLDVDHPPGVLRRSNDGVESLPDTGTLRRSAPSSKAEGGNAADAPKARARGAEQSPEPQAGNAVKVPRARANDVERIPGSQPENAVNVPKARANDVERSRTERSNARPSVTSPPTRVEREPRPPAVGRAGGDAGQRRIDSVRPQQQTRPAPPSTPAESRPAAERPRRTESSPASRPSREQTNPGAGSGERRKKK